MEDDWGRGRGTVVSEALDDGWLAIDGRRLVCLIAQSFLGEKP